MQGRFLAKQQLLAKRFAGKRLPAKRFATEGGSASLTGPHLRIASLASLLRRSWWGPVRAAYASTRGARQVHDSLLASRRLSFAQLPQLPSFAGSWLLLCVGSWLVYYPAEGWVGYAVR